MLGVEEKALELLIRTFKRRAKDKLRSSGRGIWTGKLIDSISGDVVYKDGQYTFDVNMEEYGVYIDQGVNGVLVNNGSKFSYTTKKPPIDAIEPWAKTKGLNPWAVQNSIYTKGIKGIHFFENVLDYEVDKMAEYISEIESDFLLNEFGLE